MIRRDLAHLQNLPPSRTCAPQTRGASTTPARASARPASRRARRGAEHDERDARGDAGAAEDREDVHQRRWPCVPRPSALIACARLARGARPPVRRADGAVALQDRREGARPDRGGDGGGDGEGAAARAERRVPRCAERTGARGARVPGITSVTTSRAPATSVRSARTGAAPPWTLRSRGGRGRARARCRGGRGAGAARPASPRAGGPAAGEPHREPRHLRIEAPVRRLGLLAPARVLRLGPCRAPRCGGPKRRRGRRRAGRAPPRTRRCCGATRSRRGAAPAPCGTRGWRRRSFHPSGGCGPGRRRPPNRRRRRWARRTATPNDATARARRLLILTRVDRPRTGRLGGSGRGGRRVGPAPRAGDARRSCAGRVARARRGSRGRGRRLRCRGGHDGS